MTAEERVMVILKNMGVPKGQRHRLVRQIVDAVVLGLTDGDNSEEHLKWLRSIGAA